MTSCIHLQVSRVASINPGKELLNACVCIGKPDWRLLKEFLMKEGPLKKEQVTKILKDGINLMSKTYLV